ncbi:hypothetical protein GWI33_014641 [Rhynchophorus ferrugineus]|uniref:DNA endonuclease RBBP8 n=1 Tax=Rhynchophorus ferrugineus TaxID=354439 RepID=A0A834I132_RHYFE|nr:hypothetical protein GWI33_014641 [Rhynchophorus ferrugineus]
MTSLISENIKNSAAFQAWTLLFTDKLYKTWETELNEDLRPLSMLMCSIKLEMNRIQNNLDISMLTLQTQHKISNKTIEGCISNENKLSEAPATPTYQESPVLSFNYSKPIRKDNSSIQTGDSPSIIISDEDMANTGILGDTSPEIKKRRKLNFSRRHRRLSSRTPSPNVLKDILKQFNTSSKLNNVNGCSKIDNTNITPDKNSMNLDDFDNSSVVQCTPTNTKLFSSKRKEKMLSLRGKSKGLRSLTLKQTVLSKVPEKKPVQKCVSVDHFENTNVRNSGLTELVNYMNDNISSNIPCKENLSLSSHNSRHQQDKVDQNEAVSKPNLNNFLAKAHKVQQPEYEPVVRGKARRNLPGWSCKECEKFYLNQGLTSQEIVALSKCSRHRGYAPREDTNPGFWDMNMSSEDT